MIRFPVLPLGAAAILSVGCHAAPTSVSNSALTATVVSRTLWLQNHSTQPVNYFVVARDVAPLMDWAPCAGPACPVVPAAGTVSVPFSEIAGLSSVTTEAIVNWWHSVPDGGGGFRPDSLRAFVIPL
jgi:hypothetical protein